VDDGRRHLLRGGRVAGVDPVELVTQEGGIAPLRLVRSQTTRRGLARALETGTLVRLPRHQIALPGADDARRAAAATGGVVSHLSAAQHWGWKVKLPPARPSVTVPRGRRLDRDGGGLLEAYDVHWADLPDADDVDGVTAPVRTVVDCARDLPFDAALAVADSARRGGVSGQAIADAATRSPRTGRVRAERVAREASDLADNPFESVLRAIALDVPGLHVRPQGWISRVGRADMVDEELRVAIEAESWTHHGSPEQFRSDARRYTDFARLGWVVARFVWEQAMYQPEDVHEALAQIARIRRQQLGLTPPAQRPYAVR
jgi:very-short-patch-repair endonuclease